MPAPRAVVTVVLLYKSGWLWTTVDLHALTAVADVRADHLKDMSAAGEAVDGHGSGGASGAVEGGERPFVDNDK